MPIEIEHDEPHARFVAPIEGELAMIEYTRPDARTLDLYRTFVPPAGRGHGLAALLVRAALDHAAAEGLRVIPTCSYVAGFIDKHPEYEPLVHA